jgi:hypothetical protein
MEMLFPRRTVAVMLGRVAAAALLGTGLTRQARAAKLGQPEGKVILTISGQIAETNRDGAAVFDRPMLEALGMESFSTTTPWYDGPVKFEGVRMSRLLDTVGATGTSVTAMALNDYSSEIPIEDFRKYPVILALKRDGDYMPVKDKGPLFIVYPYDSNPELKHQRFYSRSAWQVARLIVK